MGQFDYDEIGLKSKNLKSLPRNLGVKIQKKENHQFLLLIFKF
jgi:hypothetical protein